MRSELGITCESKDLARRARRGEAKRIFPLLVSPSAYVPLAHKAPAVQASPDTLFLPTGTVRRTCLPPSYTKGDYDFPGVIMASPFHMVAYPFLQGKRPNIGTCIYSYAYK